MLSIHNAYDQRSVSKRKLKRKDPLNKCKLPCPRPGEKQEEIYEEGTRLPFCRSALQPVNFFFQKDLFLKGFCFSNLMQCPTKLREMSSFLDISPYSFLSFLFFFFFFTIDELSALFQFFLDCLKYFPLNFLCCLGCWSCAEVKKRPCSESSLRHSKRLL